MKINLWQAIVILVVAFAVLASIQTLIASINPSSVPSQYQELYNALTYIFASGAATILFTFLRNILGYVENSFQASPDATAHVQYEAKQLGATMAKFSVYIYGFTAAIQAVTVGTPIQQYAVDIAGAIGLVIDIIVKSINDLAQSKSTPTSVPSLAPVAPAAPA